MPYVQHTLALRRNVSASHRLRPVSLASRIAVSEAEAGQRRTLLLTPPVALAPALRHALRSATLLSTRIPSHGTGYQSIGCNFWTA